MTDAEREDLNRQIATQQRLLADLRERVVMAEGAYRAELQTKIAAAEAAIATLQAQRGN